MEYLPISQKELNSLIEEHELWIKSNGKAGKNLNLVKRSLNNLNITGNLAHSNWFDLQITDIMISEADLTRSVWEHIIGDHILSNGSNLTGLKGYDINCTQLKFMRSIILDLGIYRSSIDSITTIGCDMPTKPFEKLEQNKYVEFKVKAK